MGRRAKRALRCGRCRMHEASCMCAAIGSLDLATKVVVVMHHRELWKTTGTGRLVVTALANSELHVHGEVGRPLDLRGLHSEERRVLLLFPSADAAPLTPELLTRDRRPVTLVVPDGTWRQARRAARRVPGLREAEQVVLAPAAPSRYRLRREPRDDGLGTCEAVARALGVLESEEAQRHLEGLFDRLVGATLATRATERAAPQAPLQILYRDADLVAVNKPPGMAVHRGWAADGVPAVQALRDQLGARVYPVHRLDRPASGALLFALSSEVARDVQAQFATRTVKKRYLALCRGHDAELVRVDHPVASNRAREAKPAVTEFTLLGRFERYGLYEARPQTGRLHQIRRHLKHASHPIIGDVTYGKGEHNRIFRERFGFRRLALHARELVVRHPRRDEILTIRAPLPPDFASLIAELGLTDACY